MSTKKVLIFFIFSSFLLVGGFAHAATTDNRYFVQSTSAFWEKTFQARNIFSNGFTADLSDWQLRLASLFGIKTQQVGELNILAAKTSSKTTPTPAVQTDQVDWGVKTIYGDSQITSTTGGDNVTVAVLDTGVDLGHPDLKDRIVGCEDFTGFGSITDNQCDDGNGHGTHVAGIIAADGGSDGSGIYGIAPKTGLMILKVCSDDGSCLADDVAAGIRYATDSGADIILVSAGSNTDSGMIDNAINYASNNGVMVIAAAGNDGPYKGSLDFPAANPQVISVGAIDSTLSVPDWSSRGMNETDKAYVAEPGDIEFAAPGVNIRSTWNDGGYATLSGTSMAAAEVAGLAAKEWQFDAKNPASSTRDILHKFSVDIAPTGDDNASGWGLPQL